MGTILIDKLLMACVKQNASDIHITVGQPPVFRIHGRLRRLDTKTLEPEDTTALMKSIAPDRCQQELQEVGGSDFGFAFGDLARFRVSIFKQRGNVAMVLRQIPNEMLSLEQLGLPKVIEKLCLRPRGLFLVTGPTGSGKTTSLASMVNFINETVDNHIITVEDPIEFHHTHKKSTINQREVHVDVPSFAEAIRRALRMDPDVILVGELRDLETIEAAITAAETGHLVFGTLHTTGAQGTINRIIDVFPTNQQDQIRTQLSVAIIAVLSQTLLPKIGGGRVAAYELLVVTPGIANLIRENKTFRITSAIQTGAKHGMRLLDDALFHLWRDEKVVKEEVMLKAAAQDELAAHIANAERGLFDDESDVSEAAARKTRRSPRSKWNDSGSRRSWQQAKKANTNMAMRRIGQIFVDLGFIDDDQLEMLLQEQRRQHGQLLGKIAIEMGLVTDEQLAQALAEQMDMRVVAMTEHQVPPEVLQYVPEPMAQLYKVIPIKFESNRLTVATSNPQNLSVLDEMRTFLGFDIEMVVATEPDINKALDKYYSVATESFESVVSDLADDRQLTAAAQAVAGEGAIDLTSLEAVADSAGAQAAEHGPAAGDQGPRQRHPFRAVRGRVPHPHQGRRRAVRDGASAAASGLCHHHADQGDGQPGHCRAASAPGRPHRAFRGRTPGRHAGQRAAHDVRRERGVANPGPQRGLAGPEQNRHGRPDAGRISRGDPEAQRDHPGDGAHGLGKNDDPLFRPLRAERRPRQTDHDRGAGGIRHRWADSNPH